MLHDVVVVWPSSCKKCCAWECALVRFSTSNMSQHDGQTHATCCAQQCCGMFRSNVAIVWPELANVVPTMLGYVALRCCYRLAGAFNFEPTTLNVATHRNMVAKRTQHVAPNNVAICCVGMFRSFGRGLSHRKGPFTLASCRAAQLTQCSFRHTEVATSCDFVVILV